MIVTDIQSIKYKKDFILLNDDYEVITKDKYYAVLVSVVFGDRVVNRDKFNLMKKFKNNIICRKNQHFGSKGKCYGFGIRPSYVLDTSGYSIGPYANKRKKEESMNTNAQCYVENVADSLEKDISQAISDQKTSFKIASKFAMV